MSRCCLQVGTTRHSPDERRPGHGWLSKPESHGTSTDEHGQERADLETLTWGTSAPERRRLWPTRLYFGDTAGPARVARVRGRQDPECEHRWIVPVFPFRILTALFMPAKGRHGPAAV